ncbi:DUF1553 domain-containing protein [Planctomicrobium sp. SH661]|uniref:DUF1553 domain-containing protein n=1 Tax=Planctomicrobium sp. SH661 TaxID=3448124 RepID=UPI003F5BC1B1
MNKLLTALLLPSLCLLSALYGVSSCSLAIADDQADFAQGVAKIFEQRCLRCHSTDHAKGGFSFSSKEEFFKGGESGAAVVARRPEESSLLEQITGENPAMPAEGAPLTAAEVEQIRSWIVSGAEWPEGFVIQAKIPGGLDWWSFQPVKRPSVPAVKHEEWPRNDLDRFILAKLEEHDLSPSPEADRRTLIRRLSFDLLGLPPTYEEIEAFVADQDPQAYERLVDRMLESPRYGERWARHWLDIAHYADTHGFERDMLRENAWRYRDYVIEALNTDRPYDEFIREQIAGDVLRPDDSRSVTATGFLAAGPWDFVGQVETVSPTLKRAARADDLDDMVTQVMTTTIGLTVNCARCHDHKLDPITQKEYYQLWSVFAGVRRGDRDNDPAEARRVEERRKEILAEQSLIRARQAELRGRPIKLADIVGGGDGHGSGKAGSGIDPLNGQSIEVARGFLPDVVLNQFAASPLKFVDGVVIPDESESGTQISSTGLMIRDVPKTSGQVWDAIRFGPLNSQFSTKLGEIDFASSEHTLLSLHANAAITFDLDELRQAGAPAEMKLTTSVGYFGQTTQAGASLGIYLDGLPKVQRAGLGRDDGLVQVEIDIPASARFLTLMSTDNGNGISHDQIGFGDAWLLPMHPAELSPAQLAELNALDMRLPQTEMELNSLPAATKVYGVVSDAETPAVHLLHRGDPEQSREEVEPKGLACLTGISDQLELSGPGEGARRLALANWIVDPANPLTRRVLVNRLWHHHFGAGLVETPSDFGFGGGRPSHPELLDWLADEFLTRNWSIKNMHRLLCTSATYRQQSSVRRPHEEGVDSANRLLWRMNSRRLDAESLWDATLMVTGKLNLQMSGPGFRDFQYTEAYAPIYDYVVADSPDQWRRAVYRFIVRTTPQQFMTTLDCPNPANLTPVRNVTTTALQSLAMLNNGFMLKQSRYFSERVKQLAGESPQQRVQFAFELAFGRNPKEREEQAAIELLKTNDLPQLCRMLLNANEFVSID